MAQDTLLGFPAHTLPYRFLDSLRQGKHLPFWPVLTSFWKGALLVEKRIDRVIFTCGGTGDLSGVKFGGQEGAADRDVGDEQRGEHGTDGVGTVKGTVYDLSSK